jgi:hypothetical protein
MPMLVLKTFDTLGHLDNLVGMLLFWVVVCVVFCVLMALSTPRS